MTQAAGALQKVLGVIKEADFARMTRGALEFARGTFAACSDEHNWYEHFQLLMKHPVISAGVGVPIADGPKTTFSPFRYRILRF